jgi:tRNA threonylcarbamoyladenosine biosynthesis protein TsaB
MALILLLETATTSCSVALALDEKVIAVKELSDRNIHASHITLFVHEVIEEAGRSFSDLDAVAVSKGPGSYTGLRIGISTAKGLCYALDIPLIAINTLKSMANGMISSGGFGNDFLYCPMIDARRMEVYTAIYDHNLNEILPVQAKIIENNSFDELLSNHKIVFFGDGAFKCSEVLANPNAVILNDFNNAAADMSDLALYEFNKGNFEDVAYFEPLYLKDFIFNKPRTL